MHFSLNLIASSLSLLIFGGRVIPLSLFSLILPSYPRWQFIKYSTPGNMMAILLALTISFLSACSPTLKPMLQILSSATVTPPHSVTTLHQSGAAKLCYSNKWFQKLCGFKYQKFNSPYIEGWLGIAPGHGPPWCQHPGQWGSHALEHWQLLLFIAVTSIALPYREPGADPWGPQKTRSWATQPSSNTSPKTCDFPKCGFWGYWENRPKVSGWINGKYIKN